MRQSFNSDIEDVMHKRGSKSTYLDDSEADADWFDDEARINA